MSGANESDEVEYYEVEGEGESEDSNDNVEEVADEVHENTGAGMDDEDPEIDYNSFKFVV